MNRSEAEIREILAGLPVPKRAAYPELQAYSRDELYHDFFGGGGLYLAAHMTRPLHLQPGQTVLDLGCGKGSSAIFLARHFGVRVVALDLWTSVEFLDQKFGSPAIVVKNPMADPKHVPVAGQILPFHTSAA